MTKQDKAIEWFTMLREKFTETEYGEYLDMAIEALKDNQWQKGYDTATENANETKRSLVEMYEKQIEALKAEPRLCRDCKFFETDSWAKIGEIPLIVAHEICNKWGGGCKTSEDGYCFLFEPKMEGVSE